LFEYVNFSLFFGYIWLVWLLFYTLSFAKSRYFVSLSVSLNMPTFSCRIDRPSIDKFTKEQRASGERVTLSDTACSGLKLVINSQSASWVYAYRKRGYLDGGRRHPQRTMKLGDPATMTPAEARLAGEDPAMIERRERADRQAAEARRLTCAQWADRYEQSLSSRQTKHVRDEVRNVRLALNEMRVSNLFPEEITSKLIRSLVELHAERPATSRHRYGALSRFLEEVIDLNPAQQISKKRRPKPPTSRVTHFSVSELRQLWHAEGLKPEYQRYLRFMITTPLRAMEAAELRWDQVHTDEAELRLMAADTKNAEYFVMPLTGLAEAQLGGQNTESLSKVFQLTRADDGEMSSWSHFAKTVRKATGVESFALHHLRRTFSTLMAEHTDIPEGIIDGLLNHKQSATRGGVIRHYQLAKQLDKRRATMAAWGELLEQWM
jgi:integrase